MPDGRSARAAVTSGHVIRFAVVLALVANKYLCRPTEGPPRSDHTPRSGRRPRRAPFVLVAVLLDLAEEGQFAVGWEEAGFDRVGG